MTGDGLPRVIQAGDAIHYVALLDADGNTLTTIPMTEAMHCPHGAAQVSVSVSLHVQLYGEAQR